jgi:2-phosphosulfolactate phosphatase
MPKTLEVILSPALYPYRSTQGRHISVVIDILRFTTSLVSAFENGVDAVIPVSSLNEAENLKKQGFPVAAEREGLRLPFADYGNSAADFRTPDIKGKTLAYSTTNGTVAMNMASENGPVVAAAFSNLPAVAEWLNIQNENVVILCSAWKNLFSFEDTLCAGALTSLLLHSGKYQKTGDETDLSISIWETNKDNLIESLINTSHYKRLIGLGVDPLPEYTVQIGTSSVIPVFENKVIENKG